jgi:hypothetical protein
MPGSDLQARRTKWRMTPATSAADSPSAREFRPGSPCSQLDWSRWEVWRKDKTVIGSRNALEKGREERSRVYPQNISKNSPSRIPIRDRKTHAHLAKPGLARVGHAANGHYFFGGRLSSFLFSLPTFSAVGFFHARHSSTPLPSNAPSLTPPPFPSRLNGGHRGFAPDCL